ncbi:MAG: hypothetical protein HOC77_08810 [Chloroflexi bacterium]|jgi:hypothetical protein|nr:hypothetical protein [Chloroflexota bacterium]MBT4074338.1 hypothetical protein [Chloroflexota bacterium]MBT4515171.1 hypothetical protein [Chloroflexota bacterium]MBT5319748.1 hypothetical protein [Chloroflexota bacterium]MBT6681552.1 hypothetical protein [Chloroflexota bacterium]
MKKLTAFLLMLIPVTVALIGCSSEEGGPTGTAAEIADKIFEESGVDPFGMSDVIDTDDKLTYYLGSTNYSSVSDAAVVLPMISLDTRALYVIKAENGASVDDIRTQLDEDIDPQRLICVSFTMEDVVIESRGDVIFMTINSNVEQRDALVTAFAAIQ